MENNNQNNNESFNNETDSNQSEQELSRRKALSVAAVGLASLLVSNLATAQKDTKQTQSASTVTTGKQTSFVSTIDIKHGKTIKNARSLINQINTPLQFDRSTNEKRQWEAITTSLDNLLSITNDGTISGTFDTKFLRIEKGFSFTTHELDTEFLFTHIEPLIDQAADLLDRCIKDRSLWDDLSIKMFNLAIELKEFKELDKIHLEEEKEGIYDYPWKLSVADYNAESINFDKNVSNFYSLQWILQQYFSGANIQKMSGAQQLTGILSGFVPYSWRNQEFAGYNDITWNGVTKKFYQHSQDAATTLSFNNLHLQSELLALQKTFYENQKDSAEKKMDGLKAKAEWDKKNANFLRRRTIVSRNLQQLKTKSTNDDDGILNYVKRLIPIKERFDNDFRDALARMKVVESGLRNIYGYNYPMPSNTNDVSYYDDCLIWSRQVIQWILKFSRKELNSIYPISVHQVVGNSNFKSMAAQGKWSFELKENNFLDMTNIRLRGISISLQDNFTYRERIWQFKITPPKKANIRHFLTGELNSIDQSFLDPCVFGRVTERSSDKASDIIGITSLYNSSPLGIWEVDAISSMPHRDTKRIDDIQIDLHLAYKWGVKK